MIIDCPKCGFRQPKDRYCANCGIDLETVAPVQLPFGVRIRTSNLFYVFLLGAFLASTAWFLSQNFHPKSDDDFVETTPQRAAVVVTGSTPLEQFAPTGSVPQPTANTALGTGAAPNANLNQVPPPPAVNAANNIAVADANASARGTENLQNSAVVGAQPAAPTTGSKFVDQVEKLAANDGVIPKESSVQVVFAEVTDKGYTVMFEAAAAAIASGQPQSGVITHFQERLAELKNAKAVRVIEQASQKIKSNMQPVVIFKGTHDPRINNTVGFTVQVMPSEVDQEGLHANVRILRTIAEGEEDKALPWKQEFSDNVTLLSGSAAFFTGTLPHRKLSAIEDQIFPGTVLSVMKSKEFQAKRSEFVIFIPY